ncbi:MAG: complex I NDUFA9 subunit family protein [Novosphingobium sp.]
MAQDLSGKLVVVWGGSGFVGRHLAQELLSRGARLRVVSRNPERAAGLKPLGNLGQVQLLRGNLTKTGDLPQLLAGADAVVNLVGSFAGDLDAVMGRGAGALAAAAKAVGARSFVQVSAIGADAEGETPYARAKAAGEAAVLGAFPGATVLRPSVLFGPDDQFVNMFANLSATLPVLPVFGPGAKLQPLLVDDLALAICAALEAPAVHGGKIYELGGPEVVTMGEFNRRVATAAGRAPVFAELPDAVSALFAALTGWLPFAPLTRQQWSLLKAGNVVSGTLPGIQALGIQPRPMGLFLDKWLVRFRKHGRFADRVKA